MFLTLIPVSFYYLIQYHGRSLDTDTQILMLGSVLIATIPMVAILFILYVLIIVQSYLYLKTGSKKILSSLSIVISVGGIILLIIEIYKYFSIAAEKLDELLRLG
jgi:hypothetical protein